MARRDPLDAVRESLPEEQPLSWPEVCSRTSLAEAVMGRAVLKPRTSAVTAMESGVHVRSSRVSSLVEHPHPVLEQASFDVDPHSPETTEIAAALIGTMKSTPGCLGLSAPQLGHNIRLVCFDVSGHEEARSSAGLVVLANPEILSMSGSVAMREECASFPHFLVEVTRPSNVVVGGTVPGSGRSVVIVADAIEARCLLHEIDHLDGISMLDRVRLRASIPYSD
jgi:peptide deformylase